MRNLGIFLIFPGFLFTVVLGMISSWLDRKMTARIQWRVGPPLYQPLADIAKLFSKQTILPERSRIAFLIAPILGAAAAFAASGLLGSISSGPGGVPGYSLIIMLALLALYPLSLAIGGRASHNTLASVGVSRLARLSCACGMVFLMAAAAPAIRAGFTLRLDDILAFQRLHGTLLRNPSCILGFIAALACVQAYLGFSPFDTAWAEAEIESGPLTEYSGKLLGLFMLARMTMLALLPLLLIVLFAGGVEFHGVGALVSIVKYIFILLAIVVVKGVSPRLRIDQAVRFFLGPAALVAAAGVVMALIGH